MLVARMNFTSKKARWLAWSRTLVLLGLCVVRLAAQEGFCIPIASQRRCDSDLSFGSMSLYVLARENGTLTLLFQSLMYGFLSIDCGSEVGYVDTVTGIQWVTDEGYIKAGQNSNRLTDKTSTTNNATQLLDLRFFPEPRNKHCYVLPVEYNRTYLVRSTFLYTPQNSVLYNDLRFNITVNSDPWATISYGGSPGSPSLSTTNVYEMIFRTKDKKAYICLVKNQGIPFISSLELRRLQDSMYNVTLEGRILLLYNRFNFGVNTTDLNMPKFTRYPDDPFDRYWRGISETGDFANSCPNSFSNTTVVPSLMSDNLPPVRVMTEACIAHNDSSIMLNLEFPAGVLEYYAVLYLQEIDGNVSDRYPRRQDITVSSRTNNTLEQVNATLSHQGEQLIAPSTNLSDYLFVMTVTKTPGTSLDPIVNAAEIYGESYVNNSITNDDDVQTMNVLKESWNLTDWTGDPCIPVSWDWISCTVDPTEPFRITQIILTDTGIVGAIPSAISNLTQLTTLSLNNNHLTGSIPDLSVLRQLQILQLQNNSLTGTFPSKLFELRNLTTLNVESNDLAGSVPSCPGWSNLTYSCGGNAHLLCSSGSHTCGESSSSSTADILGIAVGVPVSVCGLALVLCTLFLLYHRRRKRSHMADQPDAPFIPKRTNMWANIKAKAPGYSLDEVTTATKNFTTKIGEGSFGSVYRGRLASGIEVAVKVHTKASHQGLKEFVNEVDLLSRVHHKNLVSLLGFCHESEEKMLIYLFMSKGTLREHLHRNPDSSLQLDWLSRLSIAIHSAKGLDYLHTGCSPPIIHRDVKSSNILLDDKLVAKVSDFGLSKSGPEAASGGFSTKLAGTPGYMDPEYFVTERLTPKSDVYSFGVVLLEIVSGRGPLPGPLPDGTEGTIIELMNLAFQTDIFVMVDPNLEDKYNRESMRKVIELAATCLKQKGIQRPEMPEIVQELLLAKGLESSISRNSELSSSSGFEPFIYTASSSSRNSVIGSSIATMSFDPSYAQGR